MDYYTRNKDGIVKLKVEYDVEEIKKIKKVFNEKVNGSDYDLRDIDHQDIELINVSLLIEEFNYLLDKLLNYDATSINEIADLSLLEVTDVKAILSKDKIKKMVNDTIDRDEDIVENLRVIEKNILIVRKQYMIDKMRRLISEYASKVINCLTFINQEKKNKTRKKVDKK